MSMSRHLILGTAGHIDHGKTSLVEALTGINCDRLPEEKQRGITIDIGFASLKLGDFQLGIVDVPGHERFIKNMLAGVTGIDLVLLVVAADDSVMPQTREHLEILSLLGLRHGVIALTKSDLVDETTRAVASLEIRELVKDTFLELTPIISVSAKTGTGIESLTAELLAVCNQIGEQIGTDSFRLAIDRSFVVQGHGTVVTGSVASGSIKIGNEVEWHKGDGSTETVRVRGLNNHGQSVTEIHRGQRAAINLAGIPHESVRRGQELATQGSLKPSRIVTVRLHALPSILHPLRHRLPCRLHIGTAEVMATISLLDADRVEPGQWVFAQLFLDEPITAIWGQPFVIRDSSAEHTLGGGQILQPTANKIRRRDPESLSHLEQLRSNDPAVRAAAAVWFSGVEGIETDELCRTVGLVPHTASEIIRNLVGSKRLFETLQAGQRNRLIHFDRVTEVESQILTALGRLHNEFPLLTTHDRSKVLAQLHSMADEAFLSTTIDRMIETKKVLGDSRRIARADFKPKLSLNQRKLKDRIVAEHLSAGFAPPDAGSYAHLIAGNAKALSEIFDVAVAEGQLVKITSGIFFAAEVEAEMTLRIRTRLANDSSMTVAEIRDLLGTTRKYAVPFCEYLDRIGLTRREGDKRVLSNG